EPPALLHWIVQLAEGVRHLEAADVQLESLHGVSVVGSLFGQGRDLRWEVIDEGGLNQPVFAQLLEKIGCEPAGAMSRLHHHAELTCQGGGGLTIAQSPVLDGTTKMA